MTETAQQPVVEGRSARPGMLLAVACLCQVMVVLDISVVNVALPAISADLHFEAGALSWVVSAYTLVFGGLLLLGGRFADLVGHRTAMLIGLALFGLASVLGGLAQDPVQLIAARAGQGLAGAVLAPLSLTVIMVGFEEGARRARAIGIWSMVAAGGSALGVLLGGVLTEALSWRWVMFVNVPIAVAGIAFALAAVPAGRAHRVRRLDVAGAVLVTLAVTALVNGALQAEQSGWGAPSTLLSFAAALVLGALFAVRELRAAEPLVPFAIFRRRSVWFADLFVLALGAMTVAGFYFASLFLQQVLGYTPIQAGLAFLPFCFGTVFGAMLSGRLSRRLGFRVVIAAGAGLGAIGMLLFGALDAHSTFLGGFLPPSLVASFGLGLCMVANTSVATAGVDRTEAGLVSGLVNAARQIGGSLGLAVLSSIAVSAAGAAAGEAGAVAGYDRAFQATAVIGLVAAVFALVAVPRRAAERLAGG
jgi:EmrB/QacA subfamily drug resistance transporter